MKETIQRVDNNVITFNIIYISKKVLPQSYILYFIFFLLKFIGILITSNNYIRRSDNDSFYINDWLSSITFYQLYESIKVNYTNLCLCLYGIILIPIVGYIIIYKQKNRKKTIKFSKFTKKLIKFLSIVIYVIMLLYQHIIELLSVIYLHVILLNTKGEGYVLPDKLQFIDNFENGLNIKYPLLIVNGFFILVLNVALYQYIMLINEPFMDSKCPIKVYDNRNFIVQLIILTNYQAVCNLHRFFIDTVATRINLALCITFLLVNIAMLINFIQKFHYVTFFKRYLVLVLFYTFFSTILNIAHFHLYETPITSKIIGLNTLLCCTFSIFISNLMIMIKKKSHLRSFANQVFQRVPKKVESYLIFTELLNECISDPQKIYVIYELINEHLSKCNVYDCNCKDFQITDFAENFVKYNNIPTTTASEVIKNFKHCFEEIILLVENEIVNFIYHEFKSKEIKSSFNIFVLHIDYLFHYRKNYLMVSFLIENYLHTIKNLPFSFKFYFFLFKKKVLKYHYSNMGINKKNLVLYDFFHYFNTIDNIKKVILKNVNDFIEFIDIKKLYDTKKELNRMHMLNEDKTNSSYNISRVIDVCKNLQKHYKKVQAKIKKAFSKTTLKNLELCYIIHHYYLLIKKEIPEKLSRCFIHISDLHELDLDASNFKERNMNSPLIIQNIKDNFKIVYICQQLCEKLDYQKQKLIGEDFEIFFPDEFSSHHTIQMKKTLFLENNVIIKIVKDAFMLTKDKFLHPVNVMATSLPMLYQTTLIIMDIKKIPTVSNNYCTAYNLILDKDLNLITFTRPFFQNFLGGLVTADFLEKYYITFGQMFDISIEKLYSQFEESIRYIRDVNLNNLNSIINIFQPVSLRNTMKYTKDMRNVNRHLSVRLAGLPRVVEFVKNKNLLKKTYEKLTRLLYENNYDRDRIQSLNNLCKKILVQTSQNKLNRVMAKVTCQKVIIDNSENIDSISIRMELSNMGNMIYFKVTLIDYELYYSKLNEKVLSDRYSFTNQSPRHRRSHKFKLAEGGLISIDKETLEPTPNETPFINPKIEIKEIIATPSVTNRVPNSPTPLMPKSVNQTNELMSILPNNINNSSIKLTHLLKGNTSLNDTLGILLKGRKEEISKLKDYVKSSVSTKKPMKFNESVLLVSIIVITTIIVVLTFYNFKLCDLILEKSLNLMMNKIHFAEFIGALVYSSNSILSACIIDKNVTQTILDEKVRLETSHHEMLISSSYITSSYNEELVKIFTPQSFKLILDDWTSYTKLSTTESEINTFSYHMTQFAYSIDDCDIRSYFPSGKHLPKATPRDKLIHYIMNNVFQIFLKYTGNLNKIYDNMIVEDLNYISNEYFVFDLLYYSICIILIILTIIILLTFEAKIGYLIFFIFIRNRNDSRFERKLNVFKRLVEDSDKNSFKNFDKVLIYNNRILSKFIGNNSLHESTTNVINNMSLFNDAEFDIGHSNFDETELEQPPKFEIKLLRISLLLLILSLVAMVAIGVSSLLIGKRYIELILITKDIVANSMECLNNLSQLILYFQISIIASNTRLITFPQQNYTNINNFFNIEQDLTKDSLYTTLGESLFSNFYYLVNSNRKNLKMFLNSELSQDILIKLSNFQNVMNTDQFCNYLNNNTAINVNECMTIGHGINKLGVDNAMDSIINHITKIYTDFEKSAKMDPSDVLFNQEFLDSLIVNDEYFRLLNHINTQMISEDIPEIYLRLWNKRLVYASISLVMNSGLIVYALFIIIPKLKGYYNSLHYALKKLKRAAQKP
jgi:hypothetical protein